METNNPDWNLIAYLLFVLSIVVVAAFAMVRDQDAKAKTLQESLKTLKELIDAEHSK